VFNGVEAGSLGQHQNQLGAKNVARRQGTRLGNAAEFRMLVAGEKDFTVCRRTNLRQSTSTGSANEFSLAANGVRLLI